MSNYTTAMVSKLNASAPITRTVADDLARESAISLVIGAEALSLLTIAVV